MFMIVLYGTVIAVTRKYIIAVFLATKIRLMRILLLINCHCKPWVEPKGEAIESQRLLRASLSQ